MTTTRSHENGGLSSLEAELGSLTRWNAPGGSGQAFDAAIARVRPRGIVTAGLGSANVLNRKMPWWVPVTGGVVVLFLIVGMMLPSLGKARQSSRHLRSVVPDASVSSGYADMDGEAAPGHPRMMAAEAMKSLGVMAKSVPSHASSDRQVIRKATLELKTTDEVRVAFLKASLVVSQAAGEFVEQSSLTGDGPTAVGTLTLRVVAERLSEVLNELRPLGKVTSETAGGEDVTDRVVDLEARLRNEKRIETELLELVEKRVDAPLKEVLELRNELSRVRESIEQMTAQRERLGRLVSLATILVVIRGEAAPEEPVETPGIGAYFKDEIAAAWRSSLRALVDTATFLVRVLVGGAVWWIALAAIVLAAVGLRKRTLRARAVEPVPTG